LGSQWIEKLFSAIRGKSALRVVYKPYRQPDAEEKVFFPYLLKEYRSRWFVLGKYKGGDRVVNLALDRIQSVRNSSVEYEENDIFDAELYFKHIVGVSLPYDGEVQEVQVKVKPSLAPYILTKPIHRLQQVVKEYADGGIRISIPLIVNYELRSTLLGFGRDVEVVKPESLRTEMAQVLQDAHVIYGPSGRSQ
jgi:predicted DNA-binding transcriptional regulator YafY